MNTYNKTLRARRFKEHVEKHMMERDWGCLSPETKESKGDVVPEGWDWLTEAEDTPAKE